MNFSELFGLQIKANSIFLDAVEKVKYGEKSGRPNLVSSENTEKNVVTKIIVKLYFSSVECYFKCIL